MSGRVKLDRKRITGAGAARAALAAGLAALGVACAGTGDEPVTGTSVVTDGAPAGAGGEGAGTGASSTAGEPTGGGASGTAGSGSVGPGGTVDSGAGAASGSGTPQGGATAGGTGGAGSTAGAGSTGGTGGSAAAPADAGTPPTSTTPDAGPNDGGYVPIAQRCFAGLQREGARGPDYDQFHPTVGSHCYGTNNQDIRGVERVVFIGNSVTVGTPPTPSAEFYRSRLADSLAAKFGLHAPSGIWKTANPLSGQSTMRESGDFASCAKWGARGDDLERDHSQIADCIPPSERGKHHLVVFTIGGNDIAHLQKTYVHGPYEDAQAEVANFVALVREAVATLKDPVQFPGGVDVIFGNMYEFTDATGDVRSCPAAAAGGFDQPWDHPEQLEQLVIWANEQFMSIAMDTHSDLIFMLETFCGHGYHNEDTAGRCYRGPNTERLFDLTCIHPNPDGHALLADMFMSVVNE